MDFFKSIQDRAQQAVAAATELATKAGENAKAFGEVLVADARGIAGETQTAVKQAQKGRPTGPTEPTAEERASAHITDELLDHVRALTYASFRENEDASAIAAEEGFVLEPWQLRHATCVLKLCHELEDLRFVLSPKRMSEARFWQIYFFLARPYLDSAAVLAKDAATQRSSSSASPANETSAGKAYHPGTSWSNITSCRDGWESEEEWEAAPPNAEAPVPTPDDLDAYLKDMMDGDEQGGKAGIEEDDLDKYLDELNGSEATSDLVQSAVQDEQNLLEDGGELEDTLRELDVS